MTETQRMSRPLSQVDPEIYEAIQHETDRQDAQLELIASENFTSEAVLEATGSVFTNKYAEGYPGKRYYGGCEFTDVVENLARERAKKLFGAEHVNVQPHSGSQANQAAYAAVLAPGDTIMGMNLAHGGHLTHGHPLNFSGKTYKSCRTACARKTSASTTTKLERLAEEHKPKMIVAGASAYPRILDFARFRQIADLGRRAVPGGHGAHLRPGGRGRASQPLRVRRHRHHHHAQDAARTARRHDSGKRKVRQGHRQERCSPACRAARWCT